MGRELKRVPLDFDWPLNRVWQGFINPYYKERITCPDCRNGYSIEGQILNAIWYRHLHDEALALLERHEVPVAMLHFCWETVRSGMGWCDQLDEADVAALLADNGLREFTHRPRTAEQHSILETQKANGGSGYWLRQSNGYVPTAAEVNAWNRGPGFGHNGCYTCVEARARRYGVDPGCATCGGTADISPPEVTARIEGWKSEEPPAGEGYQLWETVSEGSPISAVYRTPEQFIGYLLDQGYSRHAAEAFLKDGWVMSMASRGGVLASDIHSFDLVP